MAYNTNTRLLLNFGGSSSTPGDTSQHAHSVGYSGAYTLVAGSGPFSDRAVRFSAQSNGNISANNFLQTGNSSACTIDFWLKLETLPDAYSSSSVASLQVAYNYSTEFNAAVTIYASSDGTTPFLEFETLTDDGGSTLQSANVSLNSWIHIRARITPSGVVFGMNGSQIVSYSQSVFSTTNSENYLNVGGIHNSLLVDCVQVLQGDNTWAGGAYSVPSLPPEDYSTGPVEITGSGENTLDAFTSEGFIGQSALFAEGANTVDEVVSTGEGMVERFAVGANTVAAVTSTTPPLPPAYKEATKLLVKFNEALTYDSGFGLNYSKDTSAGNRKVFLEFPAGLEQVGDVGVFNTPSMRFGTPFADGGVHTRGRMFVDSPAGLFSDNNTSLKRFDLWYRREATATSDLSALFTITFQNGDFVYLWRNSAQIGVNIKKSGTEVGFVASYNNFTNNVWRHIRLLLSGGNIYLAADGQQRALHTHASGIAWPGHGANPINGVIIGDFPPSVDNTNYGLRGCLDAIEWLEGDIGYTGGNYTVPTQEPGDYDPYATAAFYATGANTTGAVTSTGAAVVLTERTATGQNTTDDITASSAAGVTASASGQNTLEAVTSLGRAEDGVWWTATGANTTANVTSTGTGTVPPIRYAEGQHALDEVTSTGSSLVSDRIATGQNTLDTLTTVADGTTAGVVSGQNTVTTTSSGTATVLASATGANTLDDATSSATSLVAFNAVSQVLTEVFSVGTATALVSGTGENTVSVTSTGTGKFEIFGHGDSALDDVTTQATTSVLCTGLGANALDDVRTYFPAGYFDAFLYEVAKQQRNEHWVKQ